MIRIFLGGWLLLSHPLHADSWFPVENSRLEFMTLQTDNPRTQVLAQHLFIRSAIGSFKLDRKAGFDVENVQEIELSGNQKALLATWRSPSRSRLLEADLMLLKSLEPVAITTTLPLCEEALHGQIHYFSDTREFRCSTALQDYSSAEPLQFLYKIYRYESAANTLIGPVLSYEKPSTAWQFLNLASYLLEAGDINAEKMYREGMWALRNDPSPLHPELQAQLWLHYAKALLLVQKTEEAREMGRMLQDAFPESPSTQEARILLKLTGP